MNEGDRVNEICREFDERAKSVGVVVARLELAEALEKAEVAQQSGRSDGLCGGCMNHYLIKASGNVRIEFGEGELRKRSFYYVRPEIIEIVHRPNLESFRVIPLDDSDVKIEVTIREDIDNHT